MSLQHLPEGKTDKKVVKAAKKALSILEQLTGSSTPHFITKDDADAFNQAVCGLSAIVDSNEEGI